MFFSVQTLANTSVGMFLNASQFSNLPTQNNNIEIPDGYNKTSVIFFTQSSFLKNTRLFSAKIEGANITQKTYTINGFHFPKNSSSGIRSAEFMFSQYIYTLYGWKTFLNFGYNTKGNQNNENIQFALAGKETVLGTTLIRNPKYRDPNLASILTNILQISETREYILHLNRINGAGYTANEFIGNFVFPIYKNINFKFLTKFKNYTFESNAPLFFRDEKKIMGGLIFKSKKHNAIEFSIYYDRIIKEKGVAIGYLYFIPHSKENAVTKVVERLSGKDDHTKTTRKTNLTKEEIKQIVRETLDEMGY